MPHPSQFNNSQYKSLRDAQVIFRSHAHHLNLVYMILFLSHLLSSSIVVTFHAYTSNNNDTDSRIGHFVLFLGSYTTLSIGFLNATKLHLQAHNMERIAKLLAILTSPVVSAKTFERVSDEVENLIHIVNFLWLKVPDLGFLENKQTNDRAPSLTQSNCILNESI